MPHFTEVVPSRTKIRTCFWWSPGCQDCTCEIFFITSVTLSIIIKVNFICLWNDRWVVSSILCVSSEVLCLEALVSSTLLWNSVLLKVRTNATFFMKLAPKSLQKIGFSPPLPSTFICSSCGLSLVMCSSRTGTVWSSSLDPSSARPVKWYLG